LKTSTKQDPISGLPFFGPAANGNKAQHTIFYVLFMYTIPLWRLSTPTLQIWTTKNKRNKNRSIASAGQQRRDRVAEDRPQKNPQEQAAPV